MQTSAAKTANVIWSHGPTEIVPSPKNGRSYTDSFDLLRKSTERRPPSPAWR
jgi:hypothetical protein